MFSWRTTTQLSVIILILVFATACSWERDTTMCLTSTTTPIPVVTPGETPSSLTPVTTVAVPMRRPAPRSPRQRWWPLVRRRRRQSRPRREVATPTPTRVSLPTPTLVTHCQHRRAPPVVKANSRFRPRRWLYGRRPQRHAFRMRPNQCRWPCSAWAGRRRATLKLALLSNGATVASAEGFIEGQGNLDIQGTFPRGRRVRVGGRRARVQRQPGACRRVPDHPVH